MSLRRIQNHENISLVAWFHIVLSPMVMSQKLISAPSSLSLLKKRYWNPELYPLFLSLFFFLNKYMYLFIYLWLHWVFVAACRFSLVEASGGYSSWWCTGFSLQWLLLLQSMDSRRTGFSSCGSRAP